MSPIFVGGDDSVHWEVDVLKGRYPEIISEPQNVPKRGKGPYRNRGVEDTLPSRYEFTVILKIPRQGRRMPARAKADFAKSLAKAAERARAALKDTNIESVSFRLPVEDKSYGRSNHEQIQIEWNPRTRHKLKSRR